MRQILKTSYQRIFITAFSALILFLSPAFSEAKDTARILFSNSLNMHGGIMAFGQQNTLLFNAKMREYEGDSLHESNIIAYYEFINESSFLGRIDKIRGGKKYSLIHNVNGTRLYVDSAETGDPADKKSFEQLLFNLKQWINLPFSMAVPIQVLTYKGVEKIEGVEYGVIELQPQAKENKFGYTDIYIDLKTHFLSKVRYFSAHGKPEKLAILRDMELNNGILSAKQFDIFAGKEEKRVSSITIYNIRRQKEIDPKFFEFLK